MIKPLLSVLIPTTPERARSVQYLTNKIIGNDLPHDAYLHPTWKLNCARFSHAVLPLELLTYSDNKEMTIGEKRELLYKGALGLYSWQVDSDDDISDNAIELILEAIKQDPDCITFRENCMMNGKYYSSNHSLKYDDWADNFDGFDYVRTPFYKDVIKTEIARSVPFEHIRYGEDHAWARALKPYLKSELHIDQELYFYIHNSKPEEHEERYGIKKV